LAAAIWDLTVLNIRFTDSATHHHVKL